MIYLASPYTPLAGESVRDRFDAACGAEQMAGHRFGRADRQLVGVLAKHLLKKFGVYVRAFFK